MPRAFCPECGSEVPVDADGVCHVGHIVDVDDPATRPTGGPAAPTESDPDEPQPWVASVDSTTLGGFTPPPAGDPDAVPDDEPWTPEDATGDAAVAGDEGDEGDEGDVRADDDLAAAAAAAVESLQAESGPDPVEATGEQVESGWPQTQPAEGDVPGWTPPTNDPVAPPPVPAPAPAEPPAPAPAASTEDEDDVDAGDFDIDELAAAVSDLGVADESPAPTPGAAPTTAQPDAAAEDERGRTEEPDWEDELGEPGGPTGTTGSRPSAGEGESVDLSNFTAKSGKVDTERSGGKGGLFRRK